MDENKIAEWLTMCAMIRRIFVGAPYKDYPPTIKKRLVLRAVLQGMKRGADPEFMNAIIPVLSAYDADRLNEAAVIGACEDAFKVLDLEELLIASDEALDSMSNVTTALAKILTEGGIHIDLTDKPAEQQ